MKTSLDALSMPNCN